MSRKTKILDLRYKPLGCFSKPTFLYGNSSTFSPLIHSCSRQMFRMYADLFPLDQVLTLSVVLSKSSRSGSECLQAFLLKRFSYRKFFDRLRKLNLLYSTLRSVFSSIFLDGLSLISSRRISSRGIVVNSCRY